MSTRTSSGRPDLDPTTRMAKAMAHPLRGKILMHLNDHGTASPADLSRVLGEPIGNVSYHVRMLLDLDCVELVDTRQRRGAIEHFYRAIQRPILDDEDWAALPPAARRGNAVEVFRRAFADVSAAIDAGHLDKAGDSVHLHHSNVELDDAGWAEIHGMLDEVLERVLALQAEGGAGERPAAERRKGSLFVAHFESD